MIDALVIGTGLFVSFLIVMIIKYFIAAAFTKRMEPKSHE